MIGIIKKYTQWLHTGWPGGTVEKLPEVRQDGSTNVPGVYIVGDLTGIPLLKFSADTGARAVQTIVAEPSFAKSRNSQQPEVYDLAILGAGVSGAAAAIEAKKAGLNFVVYEASQTYSTIKNFPKGKPIFTYPTDMVPAGDLQFHHQIKEPLVEDLDRQLDAADITPEIARIERIQRKGGLLFLHHGGSDKVTKALRVIVGIGRSGNYRKLGAFGEDLDKVYNRLHDPKEFVGKQVMVVGGGDSAMEAAIALTLAGAHTTLSYRKPEFSRPKPENIDKLNQLAANPLADVDMSDPTSSRVTTGLTAQMLNPRVSGSLNLEMGSQIQRIEPNKVTIKTADGATPSLDNDVVFSMIGREAPLDFFRRSGITINGEWTKLRIATLVLSVAVFTLIYQWKKGGNWIPINEWFTANQYFPFELPGWWASQFADKTSLLGTVHISVGQPGFWYTLAYTLAIGFFGYRRVKRRRTPYVKKQTTVLFLVQVIPLFLLPYLILPYMGYNGCFDAGFGKTFADEFFPIVAYGYGREYWRAFGFILAWPLFFWNVFETSTPLTGWLIISLVQTFVILPLIIRRWGKGVYCGWICSCGALAETMGDTHRHKMPHGPKWNRLNMIGQFFLALSFIMLIGRVVSWAYPTETQLNIKTVQGGVLGDGDALIIRGQRFTGIRIAPSDADYGLATAINAHFYNQKTKVLYAGPLEDGGIELRALDNKHIGIETEGNATEVTGIEATASAGEVKFGAFFHAIYKGILKGIPGFNYVWFVDLLFAGIIGVGLYFHFSGRVWCRFACPLAALMNIYARFSKFRIFPEKKKCISCNVCTSVCHQGIDVMNFANKGLPMEDPQCVRCSACVQSCPTGVLQFGRYGQGEEIIYDRTPASLVQMAEVLNNQKAA